MMTHQNTRVRSEGGQYTIVLCSQNTMYESEEKEVKHFLCTWTQFWEQPAVLN